MVSAKCLICFCTRQSKLGKGRKFYKIPEYTKCARFSDGDKVLIEKRRRLWMKLVERNLDGKPGNYFVCSHHFVSGSCQVYFAQLFFLTSQSFLIGKPAYLYSTGDIDWVPTLHLGSLVQENQCTSTSTSKAFSNFFVEPKVVRLVDQCAPWWGIAETCCRLGLME